MQKGRARVSKMNAPTDARLVVDRGGSSRPSTRVMPLSCPSTRHALVMSLDSPCPCHAPRIASCTYVLAGVLGEDGRDDLERLGKLFVRILLEAWCCLAERANAQRQLDLGGASSRDQAWLLQTDASTAPLAHACVQKQ